MATIPLEDSFTDIIGKAQRGHQWNDDELAERADVSLTELNRIKGGEVDESVIRSVAGSLSLGKAALVDSAKKSWYPKPQSLPGLAQFNTIWEDMTVNAYLVWDPETLEAAAFDTGADCGPILESVRVHKLSVKLILLTHTHPDHIADLARLKQETGAVAHVCQLEKMEAARSFSEGHAFKVGRLNIETRQTSGHSAGGITYVISGLAKPVAVVGDALFAGSMGGGLVSYNDALSNNRNKIFTLSDDTIICPGHGPLTTVGEEKQHNPFYPEFQKN